MMENIEEKIVDIESKLIEQEHRPFHVITNFLSTRKQWPRGSQQRDAALKALIWRLFFSPTTVAISAGGIGLLSLMVLVWQTRVIQHQNTLIENQNKVISRQFSIQTVANAEHILYDTTQEKLKRVRSFDLINDLVTSDYKYNYLDFSSVTMEGDSIVNKAFDNSQFRHMMNMKFANCSWSGSQMVQNENRNGPVYINGTSFIHCNFDRFSSTFFVIQDEPTSFFPIAYINTEFKDCQFIDSDFWIDGDDFAIRDVVVNKSHFRFEAKNSLIEGTKIIKPKSLSIIFNQDRSGSRSKVSNLLIEINDLDNDILLDFREATCKDIKINYSVNSESSNSIYLLTDTLEEFELLGDSIAVIEDQISYLKMFSAIQDRYELGLNTYQIYEVSENLFQRRSSL